MNQLKPKILQIRNYFNFILFLKKKNLLASKRRTNCSTFLDIVATATSRVKTSKRVNLNVTESNRVTDWDSLFLKSEDKIGKLQTKKKLFLCVTSVYSQFLRMELLVVLLNPENLLREKKKTLFFVKNWLVSRNKTWKKENEIKLPQRVWIHHHDQQHKQPLQLVQLRTRLLSNYLIQENKLI